MHVLHRTNRRKLELNSFLSNEIKYTQAGLFEISIENVVFFVSIRTVCKHTCYNRFYLTKVSKIQYDSLVSIHR